MAPRDITDIVEQHWGVDLPVGIRCMTETEPLDFSYSSDFANGVLARPSADGKDLLVGYIVLDDPSISFWDQGELGSLHEFKRNEDIAETLKEAAGQTPRPLLVQRYSHGAVHYSLTGTMTYVGHQWDAGDAGLYTPPADLYETYQERIATIGEKEARSKYFEACNAILNDFSEWANGHVYAIAVETWSMDPERHLPQSAGADMWGGFYGWDHAEGALREEIGMNDASPASEVQEEALPSPAP